MKIIKFEAPYCSPCNSVSAFLDSKNIEYKRISAFDDPDFAINHEIMSIPTVILLDESGRELKRSIGFKPEELQEIINQIKQ
jgi:thioredoxin 1